MERRNDVLCRRLQQGHNICNKFVLALEGSQLVELVGTHEDALFGIGTLEAAVDSKDAETAHKAARALRKSAEKLCLTRLAEECSKVEKSDADGLEGAYIPLRSLYISIASILEGEE